MVVTQNFGKLISVSTDKGTDKHLEKLAERTVSLASQQEPRTCPHGERSR